MLQKMSSTHFYTPVLILLSYVVFVTNTISWFTVYCICMISIYFVYVSMVDKLKKNEKLKICVLIPARYGSSRLPGKPLLKINNKTIIQLTWENCTKIKSINENDIYVVTDDMKIKAEIESHNGNVIMVQEDCLNGTERICKALSKLGKKYDIVVNVQGDEPFINPKSVEIGIQKYLYVRNEQNNNNNIYNNFVCSTLHCEITNEDTLKMNDRSIVKVILDKYDRVIYYSRALIPHTKSGKYDKNTKYYAFIGVYVYDREYLYEYMQTNPTMAQLAEDVEQLKMIEDGYCIVSSLIDHKKVEIGVNTMKDYQYLLQKYGTTEQ
eukprot:236584_1